jgi:hypothetical protein
MASTIRTDYFERGSSLKTNFKAAKDEIEAVQGRATVVEDAALRVVYDAAVTVAEANAAGGETLIAGVAGKQITVHDFEVITIGGAAGAVTSVDLESDNETPVVVAALAAAALTENAIVKPNSANVTLGAGYHVALGAGDGLRIIKNGSDITTATSFKVYVVYTIA